MIREVIGDKYGGMEILYFKENTPLGTGGAKNIAKTLKCRVLVMNGDTFHNIKKKKLFEIVDNNNLNDIVLSIKG